MDSANLSKKELKAEIARLKVIAGEDNEPVIEDESAKPVTKADLQNQVWELNHQKDVELYGDSEYQADLEAGIPRDYALKTAKLRYTSNPDSARLDRQRSMGSGSAASNRNIESEDLAGFDPVEAAKWGYSKESYIKQMQLKKSRGQA